MFQKLITKINDLPPKQLLMLAGVAGLLMFVTIFAAFRYYLADKEEEVVKQQQEKPVVQMVSVVVAKVNMPPRTRIQESMLQLKELPADMVPEGAITSFQEVKNVAIKVSIFAGDVLTIQKVFAEKGDEGFTGSIPSDCRAVSISVNDLTGVAGFAKPGDKVDLLLVEKGKYSATTEIILQNVPLLSINQDTGNSSPAGDGEVISAAISNPSIATFALHPQEVLKLISASRVGEIYMMLRPLNPNQNYVSEVPYTIESLVNTPPPAQPAPAQSAPVIPANPAPQIPQAPPVSLTPKIEIIQGDQIIQKADANPAPKSPTPNLPQIPSNSGQPIPPVVNSPTN